MLSTSSMRSAPQIHFDHALVRRRPGRSSLRPAPSLRAAPSPCTPSSRTNAMSCSTTTTVRSRLISLSSSAVCCGLGVGHAGDRLVDQQQLRVLRQQHADLEPLLLAVRQAAGERARARAPSRTVSRMRVDALALARGCSRQNSVARGAPVGLQREHADCPRRCGSRTRSASGTCGRCRARRSRPRRAWSGRCAPSK